jgi:hypothetical protein
MDTFTGMVLRKWLLLIVVLLLAMPMGYTQEGKTAEASKKKEEIQKARKKAYENARKWTLKHRRAIQTKETRKRMDEADKRADAYNRQNNKKWWEKICKKRRHRS